ncbi:hypothetical protein EDD27_4578 [Nonomuraea polychroma]|uniref:Uncharacterized protein n=1 Tax=Nonomuraea polychroma TaxID=46176 RepID=A0A438M8B2_9ACTN|nr:hypothetical protein [Nonomuraea polychroma]RVX41964.1 hypothetical protein EDD27_4578 [Nonomuraea polychroma]
MLVVIVGLFLLLRAGRRYHSRALTEARQQGYHDGLDRHDDPRQGG